MWTRRKQAAVVVIKALCWHCCEMQVLLPNPPRFCGSNPKTTEGFSLSLVAQGRAAQQLPTQGPVWGKREWHEQRTQQRKQRLKWLL